MVAPLSGVRVLEVANWLAAPGAAALMADLGADVIKVEPPGGEAYRYSVDRALSTGMKLQTTYAFELDNRGKRSLTLDLAASGSSEVLQKLVVGSDIFVTNLIPRRRKQFGVTEDELLKLNPRLVYASVSGYGTEGAEADRAGFDYAAFWARSGIQSLMGEPNDAPPPCRGGQGDHTTALNLLAATLAALRMRDLTGEGQVVDVTLLATGIWTIATDMSGALPTHTQPPKVERAQPPNPLRNSYLCADGRWLMLVMAQPDRYWAALCKALGHPEWENDPRYDSLASRGRNSLEFTREMEAVFATATRAEWALRLDHAGLIWAPILELPDVIDDPTVQSLGVFSEIEHPGLGKIETVSTPFQIRGADIRVRGRAPDPGAQTSDILAELGFSEDQVAELATSGAFG
ncbi:MAG TPA: CoA transferase [Dehalococcoidia bacterium]|nr:CoA transferase [Dehalococcoidia bacterium]